MTSVARIVVMPQVISPNQDANMYVLMYVIE